MQVIHDGNLTRLAQFLRCTFRYNAALTWFGDHKMIQWFVHMHTTLSKWPSTLDFY